MTLCFWNNGTPKIIRSRARVKVGDLWVMNAKADTSIGLYNYVVEGPIPGPFEAAGPLGYSANGDTVTATRTVIPLGAEEFTRRVKDRIKAKRDSVMNAGIDWTLGETTYHVQTDAGSRREMVGAVVAINEEDLPVQIWRMGDNTVAALEAVDFKAMSLAVRQHINDCYFRQAELENLVTTPDDVAFIETGWPDHHVGEIL